LDGEAAAKQGVAQLVLQLVQDAFSEHGSIAVQYVLCSHCTSRAVPDWHFGVCMCSPPPCLADRLSAQGSGSSTDHKRSAAEAEWGK
jgi:hypothetical protein